MDLCVLGGSCTSMVLQGPLVNRGCNFKSNLQDPFHPQHPDSGLPVMALGGSMFLG